MTETAVEEKKSLAPIIPAGCVERKLNFRDRELILDACASFASKEGKADQKMARRFTKVFKKLDGDGVADYYDEINEKYDEISAGYIESQNRYMAYKNLKVGARTKEDVLKQYPDFDFSKEIKKPLRKRPQPTDGEQRGEEKAFHIKSAMDTWIQEALKDKKGINISQSEFWTELAEKYGLDDDTKEWDL